MADKAKMTADELQAAVHQMVTDAVKYHEAELQADRTLATEYYQGKPFGNEEEGRSQIVLTEVRDTVTAMLPSLLRVFWGAEQAVEYRPDGPEDVEGAEQATEYITRVVLVEDNPGFLTFHSWFKDALVRRVGVVKWWWDDTSVVTSHRVSGLSDADLMLLGSDPEVELTRIEQAGQMPAMPQEDGQPGVPAPLYDAEFTRRSADGRARLECVPSEEILWNKGARSFDQATVLIHRTEKMRGELIAMGVDEGDIDEHGGPDTNISDAPERIAREPNSLGGAPTDEAVDEAQSKIAYSEVYAKIDFDGDGIPELRKICTLGPQNHVVDNYPVDERPFSDLCPDPEPHTVVGQSMADYTMDLQKANSSIARAMLDSLALSIFPRIAYVEGEVSAQDVMNHQIGAPIRMTQPNMVMPIAVPFVGKEAMPVMEWFQGVKENRTGISRAAAGLNADALQSSTKAAVAATVTASHAKVELIARIFAETGVKKLFRGLLKLLVEHQPKARMVRMRGKWVQVDPRNWNANMDVSVNVALGAGLTEEKLATLAMVAAKQEQILQLLGPSNPLVTLAQYRHTLARMLELSGWKDTMSFFNEVDPNWQPPQQEPQPDPNMLIAQAELQKAQAEVAKKQAEMQARQVELQAQLQLDRERLDAERLRDDQLDDRERDRMEADVLLRARELEMKYKAEVNIAEIKARMERDREEIRSVSRPRKKRASVERDPETGEMTGVTVEEED